MVKSTRTYNRTVIIVDARNYCARHAFTHSGLSSQKHPTGMLYGALSGLIRLQRLHPNAAIVFVWDGDNSKDSWRHKISKVYKQNRTHKTVEKDPSKVAMWIQIPILEKFLDKMGFRQLKVSTLEADDLIGILAFHVSTMVDRTIIYSMDKDFYQFIDTAVHIVPDLDKTKQCSPFTKKDVLKKFGVTPKQWLQYRALVGDKGDCIFGITSIGPKTAVQLISAGVDASRAKCKAKNEKHKKVEYVKKNWKNVRLNYKLSRILRTPDHKILPGATVKDCNALLRQIKTFDDLLRKDDVKTVKVYRWMLEWLVKYEMSDLIERRYQLWQLK